MTSLQIVQLYSTGQIIAPKFWIVIGVKVYVIRLDLKILATESVANSYPRQRVALGIIWLVH